MFLCIEFNTILFGAAVVEDGGVLRDGFVIGHFMLPAIQAAQLGPLRARLAAPGIKMRQVFAGGVHAGANEAPHPALAIEPNGKVFGTQCAVLWMFQEPLGREFLPQDVPLGIQPLVSRGPIFLQPLRPIPSTDVCHRHHKPPQALAARTPRGRWRRLRRHCDRAPDCQGIV